MPQVTGTHQITTQNYANSFLTALTRTPLKLIVGCVAPPCDLLASNLDQILKPIPAIYSVEIRNSIQTINIDTTDILVNYEVEGIFTNVQLQDMFVITRHIL